MKYYRPTVLDADADLDRDCFAHGIPIGQAVWRVGSHIPPLSLPGNRLLVGPKLRSALAPYKLRFVPVAYAVIGLPDLAWHTWAGPAWEQRLDALKLSIGADSPEEIVVPYSSLPAGYVANGDRALLSDMVGLGRKIDGEPDLWWGFADNVVEWRDGVHRVVDGDSRAESMQIGWLAPGNLLVSEHVRRSIEAHTANEVVQVAFEEFDVE